MALTSMNFKHGDTEFGIFYPTGYVLSVFPDAADADRAVTALRDAGFRDDDFVIASGADVVAYSREMRANPGLLSRFEHFIAGLYVDTADLADELVGLAKRGHTFVAVHAPNETATTRVSGAMHGLSPVVLRKYDALSYTDLG